MLKTHNKTVNLGREGVRPYWLGGTHAVDLFTLTRKNKRMHRQQKKKLKPEESEQELSCAAGSPRESDQSDEVLLSGEAGGCSAGGGSLAG